MNNVIHIQPHTTLVIDTNVTQRTVYFVLGFSVIVMAMIEPPITTTWFATMNLLGIMFVLMALLGKRILPVLEGTGIPLEPRVITNTLGLLIGLAVSILAIAQPPVNTAWTAFAHFAAIILVTKAILGYDFLMETGKQSNVIDVSLPTKVEKSLPSEHLPKAA